MERFTEVEGIEIYQGDCLDIMGSIEATGFVDMVACDLPYGTTQCKWDSPIDLPRLWRCYDSLCKRNAAICLNAQLPFDKVLAASRIEHLRYEWIWEKSHATGFLNAKRMPMKAHEQVLVFYRELPTYNPIKTGGHTRKTATKRRDTTSVYGEQRFDSVSYDSTERYPRSVLRFASDKQKSSLHPTQKPVALMEYLIRTYTNPGDLVLDNCCGSGTTAIACMNTGRRFLGMEKDEKYFQVACDRVRSAASNSRLDTHLTWQVNYTVGRP